MTLRPGWLLLALLLLAARLQDEEPNQAALVVRVDDERVETRCVTFTEETIAGHELLERSGLEYVVNATSAGVFVCSVEGQGCPANDCLCQCQGEPCTYWSYWRLSGVDWQYAGVGAALAEVRDGDVEGWSWGPGSVTSAIAPPAVSFDDICAAPASAPSEPAASAADSPATSWLAYAAFLLVLLLLGVAFLWLRRGSMP
jgi:hypothetical protein